MISANCAKIIFVFFLFPFKYLTWYWRHMNLKLIANRSFQNIMFFEG